MRTDGQRVGRHAPVATALAFPVRPPLAVGGQLPVLDWNQWQQAVVRLLRAELTSALPGIGTDDVDWDAWRRFYEDGRTPLQAVNRALEKDL